MGDRTIVGREFRSVLLGVSLLAAACSAGRSTVRAPENESADFTPSISYAYGRLCSVTSEGRLWCIGQNNLGQLGVGTTLDVERPTYVKGMEGVAEVALGIAHSCARTASGEVFCWGDNAAGQVGDGSLRYQLRPVKVPLLNDAVGIAAGETSTVASMEDGSVRCWGTPCLDVSEAALGPCHEEEDAETAEYMFAVAMVGGDCVGEVSPQCAIVSRQVPELEGIENIAVGTRHLCGLSASSEVTCFGANFGHELGRFKRRLSAEPLVVPGLSDVRQVIVRGRQSCALQESGAVVCWGPDRNQKSPRFDQAKARVVLELAGASKIARSQSKLCGLTDEGRVFCARPSGGLLSHVERRGPLELSLLRGVVDAVDLDMATDGGPCVLRRDGSALCVGRRPGSIDDIDEEGFIFDPVEIPRLSDARRIATGRQGSCAIKADATVVCWGRNVLRREQDRVEPMVVPGLDDAVELAVGDMHACAIQSTGRVLCWSFVGFSLADGALPTGPPLPVDGLEDAREIAVSSVHACALRQNGSVQCWGINTHGQLGDGTSDDRPRPVTVGGLDQVEHVAIGDTHSCALRRGGEVRCWGCNGNGQLGDGTTEGRLAPTRVEGLTDVVEIGAAGRVTCARTSSGDVLCWGSGCEGQLGGENICTQPRPTPLEITPPATALRVGETISCLRASDGETHCWGVPMGSDQSFYRQFRGVPLRFPMRMPFPENVQDVAPSASHGCVLSSSGQVLCWGDPVVMGGSTRFGVWLFEAP